MRMSVAKRVARLLTFKKDPQLAISDQLEEIGESLQQLLGKSKLEIVASHEVPLTRIGALEKTFEKVMQEFRNATPNLAGVLSAVRLIQGDKGDKGDKGDPGTGSRGDQGPRGEKGDRGDQGEPGIAAAVEEVADKVLIELSPEALRDKLQSLVGTDRLTIDAIKDLREWLERLEKYLAGSGGNQSVIAFARGLVKPIDLSAQLDGVTRTFNTQAMRGVISVHLSSFPTALRPTVDYTWTTTSITFTSEVPDNSLAAGQTVIVVIQEN